ncbi:uncharacterized protein FOMMEDRAFT_153756 [Fomitiporia mediterranea MF3/22]|uniref:uncharacterized protein n=1 Tax=Fomitiporia mediterranea (strain MF3/22) TaxID=694068 RepID=UPI0004408C89|nr:uncharacterized protein FOMMEDRAFT_153756 [Fomitiporia mediterranea MF3/22]EJD04684.1 hypothetical protein FOMMEDRAFT_153756 [Fomitiporia mediterranea MF3/22]
MASLCSTGTLPPRPDIEGIGTRVATYAQLFLAIFTIALTPAASSFDAWWAVLVTSLGLQFAAVAQRHGLTLFHALIVTLLAFPVFGMSWVYIFWHWRLDAMPPEILIATHIHGFLFVGFGLWIWGTAPTFGQCPELNGTMQFVVFGKSLHPLGWIRIFVLVLYSMWGVLFLVSAAASLVRAIPSLHNRAHRHLSFTRKLVVYLPSNAQSLVLVTIFNLAMLAYSIWSVESLLLRNVTGTSSTDESSWTFGQISAIILLVGPLFTFARLLRIRFFGPGHVSGTDREGMPLTTHRTRRAGIQAEANEKANR